MDKKISVIIPVYNASALIDRCLDSVLSQNGEYELEVICIDDGSTDDSVAIIERRNDSRIKLLRQENAGPASARNRGIEVATGKYLAFIDADDYWLPNFLSATVNFLESNEPCVAVSVAQKHLTTTGEHEAPYQWSTLAPENGCILEDFYSFWSAHNHICTGSILIRTDIAKQSGGQRPDLRICEDLEYWALIASYGKVGYIPQLLFVSDGSKVTQNIGWVKKNLPRWNSAVPVDVWEKRIVEKDPSIKKNPGYIRARGRIAKNLAYSILLSKRYSLAKSEIKQYGNSYPDDRVAKILRLAARNAFFWVVLSRLLVYREYHRK